MMPNDQTQRDVEEIFNSFMSFFTPVDDVQREVEAIFDAVAAPVMGELEQMVCEDLGTNVPSLAQIEAYWKERLG